MKNLIKLFSMVIMAVSLMMVGSVYAQTTKAEKKEIKEAQKEQKKLRAALYQKPDKEVRKEVKTMEKEGWKTLGLPLAKQVEEMWMKKFEKDASGYPRYICSDQIVVASSFTAAQAQADAVAKVRIAQAICSSIAALTDIAIANQEISVTEGISHTKTVENAKILVAQKLGRTFKVMEIYQELKNGNYRIRTVTCYDMNAAISIAREIMIEELKKDSDINRAQLEKIMGMDKITEQVAKDMLEYDEVIE